MMISSGSGMCVLLHPVALVAMRVAIVHPRPLVQITHQHHGGRQAALRRAFEAAGMNSSRRIIGALVALAIDEFLSFPD
jgi:hypothetical protein